MRSLSKFTILLICLFCFQTTKAEWVKQDSDTMAWLRSVFFVNEKKGWIGGSGGTFLETGDGGKSWRRKRISTSDTIRQVYFSDERTGWILCERNAYNLGANSPSYLLKTTDGGANWELFDFTGAKRERIAGIFFGKNESGFAVGENGAYFTFQSGENKWKKRAAPAHYLMLGGTFADDFNGVMVGAGGSVLFTEDGGLSWNRASIQGEPKTKFNSVYFLNRKNGWAVGAEGKIFQTLNGGRFWREQPTGVAADINDVFFLDTAEGWAIGNDGLILHTKTGGNVWTINESKVRHKLERIFFNGKTGWAVGFGGTVLRYDAGKNNPSAPAPVLLKRN